MDPKTEEWLFEYHRKGYEFQMEQTEKIRDRIAFLAGLLTPLVGAAGYVVWNQSLEWTACHSILLAVPPLLTVMLLAVAVLHGVSALRSKQYLFVPSPIKIQRYAEQLSHFAADNPHRSINVVERLRAHLARRYCEGASHNFLVNRLRTDSLLRATKCGIWSLCFLVAALPRFLYVKTHEKARPTGVVIESPIQIKK
jgi:hypothetical protein